MILPRPSLPTEYRRAEAARGNGAAATHRHRNLEERPMKPLCLAEVFFSLILFLLAGSPCPADEPGGAQKTIVDLYKSGKLFDKTEYRAVRAAFAQRFEERYEDVIKKAYGEDYEKLTTWLKARPEVREEFYTALNEKHDKLDAALTLFKEIW